MAAEKQQPQPSRSLARSFARVAFGVAVWLFLTWVVLCLVIGLGEYYEQFREGLVVRDVTNLMHVLTVIKDQRQVDRDNDGRFEFVGWRNCEESLSAADAESLASRDWEIGFAPRAKLLVAVLETEFALSADPEAEDGWEAHSGFYFNWDSAPVYRLSLFVPRDPDRAETTCILLAWPKRIGILKRYKSFLWVNENGNVAAWCRKTPRLLGRSPQADRLGHFDGETWQVNKRVWTAGASLRR